MSSTSTPIPPARFAAALKDLPLGSLHAKAAELRNSISHLRRSNEQLVPYAAEGDRECADAIAENEEVIRRMEERVALLKAEVEGRGMPWVEEEKEKEAVNGERSDGVDDEAVSPRATRPNGSRADGEVEEEDGVHL